MIFARFEHVFVGFVGMFQQGRFYTLEAKSVIEATGFVAIAEGGTHMPTLSMFFGIIIRMFFERGECHHVPHVHAYYGEHVASYDFDGILLDGHLPLRQEKFVLAWIEIHREELLADWHLLQESGDFFKIDPLR